MMLPIIYGGSWGWLMYDGGMLDNDVLIKVCCYRIARDLLQIFQNIGPLATLAVTRIIVREQIRRSTRITDKTAAETELDVILEQLESVEPTQQEVDLAAEFEAIALAQNLPFDAGESQMLAVVVYRTTLLIVTGDKRAVTAAAPILSACNMPSVCDGRLVCLEQIVLAILRRRSASELQSQICLERSADKVLAIVFRCTSGQPAVEVDVEEGLRSYIASLRATAPNLIFDEDLFSVTS
jgi:hypothetical protein